jgi:hypothetical protein
MAKTKTKDKDTPTGPRARNDAYVMMLFITFVAIVTGTVLMYLDAEEYGNKPPPAAPKIGDIAPAAPSDKSSGGDVKETPPKVVPPKGDVKEKEKEKDM